MVILWGIFFMYVKHKEIKVEASILKDIKSVSNFSIMIEDIPGSITSEELAKHFQLYWAERAK